MIEKQMNRKINIQSFISLIFVFMFLFLNVFYLTQIKAVQTLSDVLSTKELGSILIEGTTITKEEIISQIKEKNNDLKNKNLQIVGEPTETKAKVKSNDFQGEVEVTFTVKKKEVSKVALSTVLKTTKLGEITSKDLKATKEEIISQIKEKNNDLKNKNLQIVGEPTETKAKVKSNDFQGEVEVTFTVKKKEVSKVALSTVLKNKKLGEITSKEEIISQIKEKNNDLKNKNLQIVGEPTETKATVKSDDFQGEAEVDFTVQQKEVSKDTLSTVLKTKKLGEITSKDKEEIISQIKEKNNDLKNQNLQIVGEPTETRAKVKSNDFQGEAEVEFTVKKKSFFSLFTIAIILSIGVASLVLLGYYFYEKNNKKID
ncbi:lipoprotein 17-related variable surface protein [Candidatus Phytoplasma sp. AldY-WA1]|uniref:lipoprotein 17-related variable surface protein n=1 Tax=Candidatus Phytoplasma sp. AldY-WA1 TaxID=2852100 RepID=UPI00254D1605|nr:lipoprotein 17-related variable surface protein [Candidatus Phytoplasma sp. AldY-WA1]